jgi:SAM-dependent methyltransferase
MTSDLSDNHKMYLNLACGDFYVSNENWINLDWHPHGKAVRRANLLESLDFPSDFFDAIYTSHFLEHVPKHRVPSLLDECHRVLKPKGQIRIVLPDFENIVREYITNIDDGNLELAEFNIVELIDQCVRQKSGGELSSWRYRKDLTPLMKKYISDRTGFQFKEVRFASKKVPKKRTLKFHRFNIVQFSRVYSYIVIKILPKWFVENHINLTTTGELHRWVYDFNTMSKLLSDAGFLNIRKLSAKNSDIPNFPIFPLDIDELDRSRKGSESMYLEAQK